MTAVKSSPLSVAQALAQILRDVAPLASETIELGKAQGRILASPLTARLTQPPFDASAMDGYALRASDVTAPSVRLRVIGESGAGHPFSGKVESGQAVRIFTGAPLPDGADAIIIQENVTRQTGRGEDGIITINEASINSGHLRQRGFDFSCGDQLIPAGRKLGARELSLAAAMGHGEVTVRARPVVAILSTGDELVPPGALPGPGQIVSSNHLGVAALARTAGGEPLQLGIAGDDRQSLNEHIERATAAHCLVTIGGASVGDHDLVGPVLRARGMKLAFWKIAMRPGKPLMFGTLGAQRILGLPGNPVSSLVCARVFLVPLLHGLLGLAPEQQATGQARLGQPLQANGARQHYMRAVLSAGPDGTTIATPVRSQDSSLLSAFAEADCLIIRPPNAPALDAGRNIQVLPLDF